MNKSLLAAWILGDARGYIFHGHKAAHITSTLKTTDPFPDPGPLLKNKLHLWRKPGLYSSLSQLPFIVYSSKNIKTQGAQIFTENLSRCRDSANTAHGIFRNADIVLDKSLKGIPSLHPSIMPLGIIPGLLFMERGKESLILPLITQLTRNTWTIASSIFLHNLLSLDNDFTVEEAFLSAGEKTCSYIDNASAHIFDNGINPDELLRAGKDFLGIIQALINSPNTPARKEKAVASLSRISSQKLTRYDIVHPLGGIITSLISLLEHNDPEKAIDSAVRHGGAASLAGAVTSSLSAMTGRYTPSPDLFDGIINKKRLLACTEKVASKTFTEKDRSDFINGEHLLSEKEFQELSAHSKGQADHKKKNRKEDREKSGHIVESWTKSDKSRWKRERKKLNNDKNI